MPKRRWTSNLAWSLILFPIGYFIFKTVTAQTPPPLLGLDPYQRLLSTLKMAGPALAFFFKRESPVVFLPHSFFEPEVLAPFLILLFLLVLGTRFKERSLLYLGVVWFFLTLSPLIYQPSFGKIALSGSPTLPAIGLFLGLLSLILAFFPSNKAS